MEIRDRILEAALRVFAEMGYRGATTRRIAQVADVNEVTIFRHFGSKEELIRGALEHAAREEEPSLPERPVRPYRELTHWAVQHYQHLCARAPMIRTCLGESTEHPELVDCVSRRPERVGAELRRYLGRLCAALGGNEGDADVAAGMLQSMLFTDAISRDLIPRLYAHAREAAPARYAEFVLQALGVPRETETDVESESSETT